MAHRLPVLVAVLIGCMAAPAAAMAPTAHPKAMATIAVAMSSVDLACRGCGCRGGPGYRLPNGRCAGWRR